MLWSITREGLAKIGLQRTMEMFIRQNTGDENFENLDPEL